jgi:anti-sigma regulatory factor (Ser/Thr protein kinase)
MSESIQTTVSNDHAEIERLSQLVEEFGATNNLHIEEIYTANLCLEEICTNVIDYAWKDGGAHQFDLRLHVDDEYLKITIEDDGTPFDPTKYPEPDLNKPPHERQIGGLGIHLVRQSVDEMRYQWLDGKNLLILRKKRKK